MARIFISYRHSDGQFIAKDVAKFLGPYFGTDSIFLDDENIKVASDFKAALNDCLSKADVLIAVVTHNWLGKDQDGSHLRIEDEDDYIRYEIRYALHRNIPIVPFVMSPARMPLESELPDDIREFHSRQALNAYGGSGFGISKLQLVETLFDLLPQADRRKTRQVMLRDTQSIATRRKNYATNREARSPRVRFLGVTATLVVLAIAATAVVSALTGQPIVPLQWNADAESVKRDSLTKQEVVSIWTEADQMRLRKEILAIGTREPIPRRTRFKRHREVSSLGFPDYSSFEILSDDRYWDLRGWNDLKLDGEHECFIILKRRIRLLKVAAASEIRFEAKTDGADVFVEPLSDRENAEELVCSDPSFVGSRTTKLRQLAIDVSDWKVGEERTLMYAATYWDSLQDPDDRWLGAIGYPGADRLRIYVLMPPGKPYTGFELREAPSFREESRSYDGPLRLLEEDDCSSLLWEVPTPKGRRVYTIILDW